MNFREREERRKAGIDRPLIGRQFLESWWLSYMAKTSNILAAIIFLLGFYLILLAALLITAREGDWPVSVTIVGAVLLFLASVISTYLLFFVYDVFFRIGVTIFVTSAVTSGLAFLLVQLAFAYVHVPIGLILLLVTVLSFAAYGLSSILRIRIPRIRILSMSSSAWSVPERILPMFTRIFGDSHNLLLKMWIVMCSVVFTPVCLYITLYPQFDGSQKDYAVGVLGTIALFWLELLASIGVVIAFLLIPVCFYVILKPGFDEAAKRIPSALLGAIVAVILLAWLSAKAGRAPLVFVASFIAFLLIPVCFYVILKPGFDEATRKIAIAIATGTFGVVCSAVSKQFSDRGTPPA